MLPGTASSAEFSFTCRMFSHAVQGVLEAKQKQKGQPRRKGNFPLNPSLNQIYLGEKVGIWRQEREWVLLTRELLLSCFEPGHLYS